MSDKRIKIGITLGDYNGIGLEVILKTFNEPMMYDFCTPVLYAAANLVDYQKKHFHLDKINTRVVPNPEQLHQKTVNIINCWE